MPVKTIIGAVSAIVLVVVLFAMWPLASIPAGHRGVVTLFGNVQGRVLEPGLNLINPMAHVYDVNVQQQKIDIKGDAASKDLQHVSTTLAVNYHLNPTTVDKLFANIGLDYQSKLLLGTAQDAFKGVTSQYTAEQLIGKREDVRTNIRQILAAKVAHLSGNTLDVDDVFITNFDFSKEFNDAIESKQSASQKAEKAMQDLRRIKTEAEQRIAQAEGEAKAIAIQAQAVTSQGGAAYVQLQAIQKWDGKLPMYQLGGAQPFIQLPAAR
jgi:regulator of protease activity HflC (stomatin/prohibitin superfamily)